MSDDRAEPPGAGETPRAPRRLLVLGINYKPEPIGIAGYTTGMCEALANKGHDVVVVTAQPYYPGWRVFPGFQGLRVRRSTEGGVAITRCPLYVPRDPNGARRILHHLSFALSAFVPTLLAAIRHRPHVVVAIAPSLLAAPVAWIAARLVGAACVLHVQDFEVEAAIAAGLVSKRSLVGRIGRSIERMIIRSFDLVTSISGEMCQKVIALGKSPSAVHEFRNWAENGSIAPLERPSHFRANWGIQTPHVALYAGNIANKQGIDIVVEAARLMAGRDDVMFVVCGEGPNRAALEQSARGLANIQFHELQPVELLNELLGLATIHLLPQKADAADLVLPSKLTNMLASGRPVVATAADGTGLAREVEGCGLLTPPGDAARFAEAIEQLILDPALHARLSVAARERSERVWNKERIIAGLEQRLGQLLLER